MDREDDFAAALADSTGDELLWRAFGDWLEERGDARAAWVRSPGLRPWLGPAFDPIPALIASLRAKKKVMEVRKAMAAVGPAVVPELLPLLGDADPYVRLQAVWCVRKVGKAATAAGPALVGLLKDADSSVRDQAGRALNEIGPGVGGDLDTLREVVSDRHSGHRYAAASLLEQMAGKGEVVADLIARLEGGDAGQREAAIEGLKLLDRKASVGTLCRALSDPVPQVREAAAGGLYYLSGAEASLAVGPLRAALRDAVASVRVRAASVIGTLDVREVVDDLLPLLGDDEVAPSAASALGRLGAGDGRVREALSAATASPNMDTARAAASALTYWPTLPASSADALLALAERQSRAGNSPVPMALTKLERPTPAVLAHLRRVVGRVRGPGVEYAHARDAAEVLHRYGPAAAEAVPELASAARAGHWPSARALARMGEPGTAALLGLLGGDETARGAAARGLHGAGEAAAPALPALRRMATEGDLGERFTALAALRSLGPVARESAGDLAALLADHESSADVREALEAMGDGAVAGQLGRLEAILDDPRAPLVVKEQAARLLVPAVKGGAAALPALRLALRLGAGAEGAAMRRYAAEGLGELRDEALVPELIALLRDDHAGVRREAAEGLGRLKSKASAALEALRAAARDADKGVRRAAEQAAKRVDRKGSVK